MALFRKIFYQKPPPKGLFEIAERVYVFDSCFSTDTVNDDAYRLYMRRIVTQLHEQFSDSSFLVFNFREGDQKSQLMDILSQYNMAVMDYPRQYGGCPILSFEMIHHFLRSSDSWISLGPRNILLLHCDAGGWPTLAFMLAGFLLYKKLYAGEQKALDLLQREAPKGLLRLLTRVDPMPSQIRYLQYISQRNMASEWPPPDQALTLDCIVLRAVPSFDTDGGCRPIIRIYSLDSCDKGDQSSRILFSAAKKSKSIRYFRQADCDVVKIDAQCGVQGDIVLECIHVNAGLDREEMMFRVMFNTAFIRSKILILGKDDIDALWDVKERYTKDFRAEVLFTDTDSSCTLEVRVPKLGEDIKSGLAVEGFARVQDLFNNVDWTDGKRDAALVFSPQISLATGVLESSRVELSEKPATSNDERNQGQDGQEPSRFDALEQQTSQFSVSSNSPLLPSPPLAAPPLPQVSLMKTSTSAAPQPPSPLPAASAENAPPPASPPPASRAPPSPHFSELKSNASLSPAPFIEVKDPPSLLPFVGTEALSITPLPPSGKDPPEVPPPPGPRSPLAPPSAPGVETTPADLPPEVPPPLDVRDPPAPTANASPADPSPVVPPPSAVKGPPAPPPAGGAKGPPTAPPPPGAPPPPPGSKGPPAAPPPPGAKVSGPPPPPPLLGGQGPQAKAAGGLSPPVPPFQNLRSTPATSAVLAAKKPSFKPLHWVKLYRAISGSLWAEVQNSNGITRTPKIDSSELESLFPAAVSTNGAAGPRERPAKLEKVHLIEMQRAKNCEIMLTKVKMPLPDVVSAIIALDGSILDVDQVGNLLKFCPTKEETETLKGYNGEKEKLGKCEQFFLEMMKVPRVDSKLRVFLFKLQLAIQVGDLQKDLNTVNSASKEVRESLKLREIMHTILLIGNALNQGTARGSAIGFKLDSLLKLNDLRPKDNKTTLMHYLDKVLSDTPDLLEFHKDLTHLEEASKVQLKFLAEEMQAINKSLEKVNQELEETENEGSVSEGFQKNLKIFRDTAEADVRSLTILYSEAGRNADALAQYFGEDPARCPFEQVVSVLLKFVVTFKQAHKENCQFAESERKKAEREAEQEKLKHSLSKKKPSVLKRDAEVGLTFKINKIAEAFTK